MSTHDVNCPWIYGGECDCGLASDAAERDSLRRDLAVTRAALAQCARAMEKVRDNHHNMVHADECPRRGHDDGECNCPDVDGLIHEGAPCIDGECECCLSVDVIHQALAPVDVGHAVRVEAAREAVESIAREMEARATGKAMQPTPEQWQRLTAALDALTSERRR